MSLTASTCAGVDDPLGQPQVVVERVEPLARVGQVAGVAQRHLGHRGPALPHRVDRRPHPRHVVERVEDPEHVDAGACCLLDESGGHLGRVGCVADGVAAAQQHLQAHVGQRLPQRRQPLPRILGQEPQRDVVGRATPRLDRPQLRGQPRHVPGAGDEVARPDPGGQQRLVRVPERRIRDRDAVLLAQPPGEPLRPHLAQQLPAPRRWCARVQRRQLRDGVEAGPRLAVQLVDRDLGQVGEQLGAPVRR